MEISELVSFCGGVGRCAVLSVVFEGKEGGEGGEREVIL